MIHIVKRRGLKQQFDERKVFGSIFAACLSVKIEHLQAEKIADQVCKQVIRWLDNKQSVTSDQIFKQVGEELSKLNKEAGFLYITHRDLS